MLTRSQLRHTAMGNGFAPLFEPHQREATRRVLAGEAAPEEFSGVRERLERWPAVRKAVEANLRAFEQDYTPFMDGLETLRHKMASEDCARLAACHRARARNLFHVERFVAGVRSAMSAFEKGLQAVGEGKMSVEQVGHLHTEMMDAYRKP
jgi:hypothetical protein